MVKLFHWQTLSYAKHNATDKVYKELNENIDKYVEVMLGKHQTRPNIKNVTLLTTKNPEKEIEKFKQFLIGLHYQQENSDLANIRDEILGNLNQFTYLLSFD